MVMLLHSKSELDHFVKKGVGHLADGPNIIGLVSVKKVLDADQVKLKG